PSGSTEGSGDAGESASGTAHRSTHYYAVLGPNPYYLYSATWTSPVYDVRLANGAAYVPANQSDGVYSRDGALSFLPDEDLKLTDILDGTSNTFMSGERSISEQGTTNSYRSWIRAMAWTGTAPNITFTGSVPAKNLSAPIK